MFFKAFEIERRSFSTDYMEWNLRSSARLRSAMIVNESDEARPRHRDEQPDQDPGHRRPLLGHGEADSWLVRQRTGRPLEESTQQRKQRRAGRAANGTKQVSVCLRLSLHRARSGSRRRGRSQGGASRAQQKSSSARSASTRRRARLGRTLPEKQTNSNKRSEVRSGLRRRCGSTRQRTGMAARGEHAAEKAVQGRRASERSRTAPKSRATRRQVRRRGGLLREGGARHVNAKPSPVGTSLQ